MSKVVAPAGDGDLSRPDTISLRVAFWFWLKLGFISFGGPAGQISIMHQELVERRRWISERRFLHALNYCMLLPGPEAQQLATYIGWLMHRTWGGVIAGALFVLPSLFILIALSWLYIAFGEVPVVAGLFYGIKPAVTAIVVQAAHRIGSRALKNNWLWAIAAASFTAIFLFNVPFPLIVLGASLLGYIGGRLA
ncbi:chromate transporter, partial [Pseudomonas gingeri]